jgi:hypothetical protein
MAERRDISIKFSNLLKMVRQEDDFTLLATGTASDD